MYRLNGSRYGEFFDRFHFIWVWIDAVAIHNVTQDVESGHCEVTLVYFQS